MTAQTTQLPSGLVTFLFTDIEGSTKLVHQLGDEYAPLLDAHRVVIRQAVDEHGGHAISEQGDSCFAAFKSANQAARASAQAQRDLIEHEWPVNVRVRVRMGIHSGMAWPHHGDYVALAVHQAARIMSAAQGGQILMSEFSMSGLDLALEHPELISLGRYRVRDFEHPVQLYQINDGLQSATFPAVRALPADGHNIPPIRNETIGRDALITDISSAVNQGSLLTIRGPGGVGKTRVAHEVGKNIADRWEDGVWLVDLAPLTASELVIPAIAEAVGAPRLPNHSRWQDVLDHLGDRRALVILDNCEHQLPTCRALIEDLLTTARSCAVLATSREPIRLAGEQFRTVEPLETPSGSTGAADATAVQLFTARVKTVDPEFELTDQNVEVVAAISRRLDGLPLLIELAAANVGVQTLGEIRIGLEGRFPSLEARDPSVPTRHRTLDAVLDWSFQLLGDDERATFRRLAVFSAGFSVNTATAAAALGVDAERVPMLVWSLVDRSLVTADLTANATRYRMLGTIRAYANRQLEASGEHPVIVERVSRHLLERLGPWSPANAEWLGEVSLEIDNFRTLIAGTPIATQETAQELACTIGKFHDTAHSFRDGIDELTRYADTLREPTSTRSSLLAMLADLHLRTGDSDTAERLIDAADELRQAHGAPEWDDVGVDRTRGEVARRRAEFDVAIEIAREALTGTISDRGRSRMLNLLGTTAAALGDLSTASDACLEELHINELLGYDDLIASAHGNLAEVALRRNDFTNAAIHQQACLDLATAHGSEPMIAFSLLVAARLAGERDQWEVATQLLKSAGRLLDDIGLALYEDDLDQVTALDDRARLHLVETAYETASDRGAHIPTEDAVELASGVLTPALR